MRRLRFGPWLIPALIVVLGACSSGGSTVSTGSGGTSAGSAGSAATAATAAPTSGAPGVPAISSAPVAVAVPNTPAPASNTDPCRVLSQAEVTAALGGSVGPGKQVVGLQDCVWTSADFSVSADVTFSDWDSIDAAAHGGGTSTPTAVSGVGDQAFTGPEGTLYVRKGDQGFLLLVGSPTVDHSTDNGVAIAMVLALKIFARM